MALTHLTTDSINTDATLAVSSDTRVPSVAAIKGYIAASAGGSITISPTPASGDPNAVASGGVFTALAGKQALSTDLTTIAGLTLANDNILQRKAGAWTNRTPAQFKTDLALVKADVGLANVDNISDANKPVSTAQQTALNLKANLAAPTFTGNVVLPSSTTIGTITPVEIGYLSGVTSSIQSQLGGKQATLVSGTNIKTINGAPITGAGDLTVSVTTDATPTASSTFPVQSGGVFTALGLKANLASPALTGTPTAPTAANATNTTQIATTAFVQAAVPTVNFSTAQYSGTGASGDPLLIANLSGAVITSGTIPDARHSSNIPRKDGTNAFTGANTFGDLTISNLSITGGILSSNDSPGYSLYTTGSGKLHNTGAVDFGSTLEFTANSSTIYMKTASGSRIAITLNSGGTAFVFTAAP